MGRVFEGPHPSSVPVAGDLGHAAAGSSRLTHAWKKDVQNGEWMREDVREQGLFKEIDISL